MNIEIDKKDDNDKTVGSIKINVLDTLVQKYKSEIYDLVSINYNIEEHWLIVLYDKPENKHISIGLFEWLYNPKYRTMYVFPDTSILEESDMHDFVEAYYSPAHKSEARKMGDDTELALGHTILTGIALSTLGNGAGYVLDIPIGEELMDVIDKKIREAV